MRLVNTRVTVHLKFVFSPRLFIRLFIRAFIPQMHSTPQPWGHCAGGLSEHRGDSGCRRWGGGGRPAAVGGRGEHAGLTCTAGRRGGHPKPLCLLCCGRADSLHVRNEAPAPLTGSAALSTEHEGCGGLTCAGLTLPQPSVLFGLGCPAFQV